MWPWFGLVTVWGWNGSSGSSLGFSVLQCSLTEKDASGFGSYTELSELFLTLTEFRGGRTQ